MRTSTSNTVFAAFLTMGCLVMGGMVVHAAPVTFGSATTQAGETDVFNVGVSTYGYTWSNAAVTANGVTFTGTAAIENQSTSGAGDLSLTSSGSLTSNTGAFTTGTNPFGGFSTAYKNLTKGASYLDSSGATITVTLNNLTTNHVYAVQTWASDPRGSNRSATIKNGNAASINTAIALDYNSTDAAGGLGSYIIGGFTADGTAPQFTFTSNNVMVQAVQVRDVTGVWSGATNANLNSADANFTGGNSLTTVSGLVNKIYFADTDGFKNIVANKTLAVDAAGVTVASMEFQNTSAGGAYTINGPGKLSVNGDVIKTTTGAATFGAAVDFSAGAHALTNTASAGNLQFNGVVSGGGTLNLTSNGTSANVRLNNNANTFNGTINALSGRNEVSSTGANAVFNVSAGAEVNLKSSTFTGVTINMNGGTGVNVAGDGVALRFGATTLDATSVINLAAATDSSIGVNRDYANVHAKITGAGAVTFGSQNVNSSNSGSSPSAAAELILHGTSNDWSGGMTITSTNDASKNNQQVVKLGASEVITNSNSISFTSSGGVVNGDTVKNTSILNMNGKNETVDLLVSAGGNGLITNTSVTASVLTIGGGSNASADFNGVIRDGVIGESIGGQTSSNGTVALAKIGSGTQVLSGANTYSGGTTVSGGMVVAKHSSALGTGAVTLLSGVSLKVGNGATGQQLVLGSTLTNGGSILLDVFNAGGSTGLDTGSADYLSFQSGNGFSGALGNITLTNLSGTNAFVEGAKYYLMDWANVSAGLENRSVSLSYDSSFVGLGTAYIFDTTNFLSGGYISVAAVPEPGRALLLSAGLAWLTLGRRRGRRTCMLRIA